MKIYQIIAVLTILLHATSCTDFCQSIFKTDDNTCKDYINETEQTLLRRKGNLLVLNDAFYPSHDYAKPNLLVDYFTETYREKGNIVEQYKTRGYCQSNTYTVISPVMLQTLFTGILYLFSREIGRQEKGYIRIHLQQDISHIKLTENQIDFLVDYITPWLKLYSRKEFQRNSISYNDDDKGYLCNIYEYEWYWTLITVIITTATICIFIKIVHWLLYTESKQEEQPSQATLEEQPSQVTPEEQPIPPQATPEEQPLPPQSTLEEQPPQATSEEQPPQATSKEQQITQDKKKKREEKQKKKDIKKAFFWAFGFVVSVINLIDLYLLVVETQYYTKLQRSSLTNDTIINDFEPDVNIEPHKATKTLQIILGLLIFLISGITGVICSFKCESLPKHFLAYLCKPICWCHPAIVYFVQFGNIFLFAYLLGSNILPTFFLMFVATIETISLLVFSIALVSSVVMGMALIILYIDEYKNIYISKLQAGTVISLIMYSTIVLALLSLIIAFLLILSSANVNDASSKFVSIFIAAGSASFSLLAGSQVKNKLFAQGQVFSISQGNNKASNLPSSPTNKRSNTKFEKPSNRKSKSCPANDDLLIPLLEITTETT